MIYKEKLPLVNRKLLEVIENQASGNVSKFSSMIGMSPQRINRLFNVDARSGKYPTVSTDIIHAVCDIFDLNEESFYSIALKSAIDAFQPTGNKEYDEKLEKAKNVIYHQKSNNKKSIPLIPTSAMAGALSGNEVTINDYDIEDSYVVPAFNKSDFCIRVEGDSMQPRYYSGDIIACTRVPLKDIWFQGGKVYVVSTRQGTLVKHIEKGKDEDHITLVSDNTLYKPFEIPTSELFAVAVVNGVIRVE